MRVLADTGRLRFTNTSHHVRGMALRLGWKTGAHNTILFMAVTSTRHSSSRRHGGGIDCVPAKRSARERIARRRIILASNDAN
jgi:hypothetical protein